MKRKCKSFTIKGDKENDYQAPQAISPADGSVFNDSDTKKPVIFQWTPIVPKPKGEVIYRFCVFEIKGQTVTSAIKQKPIFERAQWVFKQFCLH
ncbi:hypothetical protein MASR2M69_06240 [Bacteroidota bacterium]